MLYCFLSLLPSEQLFEASIDLGSCYLAYKAKAQANVLWLDFNLRQLMDLT